MVRRWSFLGGLVRDSGLFLKFFVLRLFELDRTGSFFFVGDCCIFIRGPRSFAVLLAGIVEFAADVPIIVQIVLFVFGWFGF